MKITIITSDNSKYLYSIVPANNTIGYKSFLETIEGDRNMEFTLDTHRPMDSIIELKSLLNGQGLIIEHVESVEDWFHPEKEFKNLISKIEG